MKKGLGKGLDALFTSDERNEKNSIIKLKINDIEPNKLQPRKHFDKDKLENLADSINEHGVVQPIIVKKESNTYIIIAGERRWRASKLAGLKTIPAIVRDITEKEVMEIALIENIQREDLNPIEEAEAYVNLMKVHSITQEELSKKVGKSRSAIANTVRLLNLPDKIKTHLIEGSITSGHARNLINVDDEELQDDLLNKILKKAISVRDIEKIISGSKKYIKKKKENANELRELQIKKYEDEISEILGAKVFIQDKNKKGKIIIEYYSDEELENILDRL